MKNKLFLTVTSTLFLLLGFVLTATGTIQPAAVSAGGSENWADQFDSYATGQNLHGVGGWKGWYNNQAFTAYTTNAQARSAPNSVDIAGDSDLVQEYTANSGLWVFTTWQYLPGDFQGQTYFMMLNRYDDTGTTTNWSVNVYFDSATGLMVDLGLSGASMPFVTDQWSKIQVVIDLNNDTQAFYYNNVLLYTGTWSSHVSGGGITAIGVVDLFANDATSVYYDDMSLLQASDSATVGTGTPGSCTEANFDNALTVVQANGSGTINFDCGGAATIPFSSSKMIMNNTAVTIDGNSQITLDGANKVRHFYVDTNASLTVKNITLNDGYDNTLGGGSILSLAGSSLTLDSATIRDSHVDPDYSGGAILSYGPVTMTHSLIEHNSGGSVGGLFLFGETAVATITNSTFRGNYTTNPDYGLVGAITLWAGADVTLFGSTLAMNTAVDGAALYNSSNGGEIYIREGSVLRDNEASQFGGAIFSSAGLVKIEDSTVADNVAGAGGGIRNQASSHLIAIDTTFVGNSAPPSTFSAGGAIAVHPKSCTKLTHFKCGPQELT